nr:hypothetical protein [uncultured Campylobacter sp.]
MRVILDGFDGSFLPILQSFKAVMPSLRITGIEEIGQSVNEAPSKDADNTDAINVSELFARQDERDEILPDGSLFLQDDKFDENVKFENARQAIGNAEFETNLAAKSERKTAFAREQILQDRPLVAPYQERSREEKTVLQTGSLSKAPKTVVLTESVQTTTQQEAYASGGATQTAPFSKAATSNDAAKTAVSDDFAQAALFDFNEPGQNLTPRAESKAELERKKHESASLFTDEEVRAILELK